MTFAFIQTVYIHFLIYIMPHHITVTIVYIYGMFHSNDTIYLPKYDCDEVLRGL